MSKSQSFVLRSLWKIPKLRWLSFVAIVFLWTASTNIFAQPQKTGSGYSLYKNIPVEARFITTDKLQQFYLINEKNDLIKYNPVGTEVFRYSNNKLGNLATVDVSNPFHILAYYPDFNTLITLDRTLSETSRFNLSDLGIIQTQALGVSYDNNIWIYDELEFRLRKFDKQGKVLLESPDLTAILPERIQPVSVLEHNNLVYLYDPQSGLLVFDLFAQYIKTIPLKNITSFQIKDKHLLGLQEQQFYVWQLHTGIRHPVDLPITLEAGEQVRMEQNCFFVLKKGEVRIYRR